LFRRRIICETAVIEKCEQAVAGVVLRPLKRSRRLVEEVAVFLGEDSLQRRLRECRREVWLRVSVFSDKTASATESSSAITAAVPDPSIRRSEENIIPRSEGHWKKSCSARGDFASPENREGQPCLTVINSQSAPALRHSASRSSAICKTLRTHRHSKQAVIR
jgi:hypothetical protein